MPKKKKSPKKASPKKASRKETSVEVEMIQCPVCEGACRFHIGWGDGPDDNDCPRCDGAGEIDKSSLDAEDRVECSECDGSGSEYDDDSCMECAGAGSFPKSVTDAKKAREAWETRKGQLPTKAERNLADYVAKILPISLDQADKIVLMLINAVNQRASHDDMWRNYDG